MYGGYTVNISSKENRIRAFEKWSIALQASPVSYRANFEPPISSRQEKVGCVIGVRQL